MAAVMGRLYRRNSRDAEGIGGMILCDDVSDSTEDGTEFDANYVETRGDLACAEDATSDGYSYNEIDATDSCLQWKGKDEVCKVKSSTHIRRRLQNILRKLPGVIGQARKTTTPFEARICLNTDKILDNIVQHTNQYSYRN
jgi:hypothetical protein